MSINADVNGAVNILKVAMNRSLSERIGTSGSGVMAHPLLLRWNYNEWKYLKQ
jgi:transposase